MTITTELREGVRLPRESAANLRDLYGAELRIFDAGRYVASIEIPENRHELELVAVGVSVGTDWRDRVLRCRFPSGGSQDVTPEEAERIEREHRDAGTYNGWANRETWALSLHLSNDQGLYHLARDLAYDAIHAAHEQLDADETELLNVRSRAESIAADNLRERVEEWAQDIADVFSGEDIADGVSHEVAMLIDEIGSRWRIDWRAVAVGYVNERWDDYAEAHDR